MLSNRNLHKSVSDSSSSISNKNCRTTTAVFGIKFITTLQPHYNMIFIEFGYNMVEVWLPLPILYIKDPH